MEYNDIYDADGKLTGRVHLRGTAWKSGEFGLVVCVWVHDGKGNVLLTRRAKEKSFAGTWENSGGAAKAGETSAQAIRRELFEETGILASERDFELLGTGVEDNLLVHHYCLKAEVPVEEIVLLPGETDAVQWVRFAKAHEMATDGSMCEIIGRQYLRWEEKLEGK